MHAKDAQRGLAAPTPEETLHASVTYEDTSAHRPLKGKDNFQCLASRTELLGVDRSEGFRRSAQKWMSADRL